MVFGPWLPGVLSLPNNTGLSICCILFAVLVWNQPIVYHMYIWYDPKPGLGLQLPWKRKHCLSGFWKKCKLYQSKRKISETCSASFLERGMWSEFLVFRTFCSLLASAVAMSGSAGPWGTCRKNTTSIPMILAGSHVLSDLSMRNYF